mgnify:CR=1 FL=1
MIDFKKDDLPEPPVGFLLAKTHLLLKRQLNRAFAEAGHDVTVEQMGLLIFLWHKEGFSQRELVNKVKKVKSSIARLIDNMEKRNLVVRVADQSDKRNKLIYLTHKGKTLRNDLEIILNQQLAKAYKGIPEENIDILKNTLKCMFVNLQKEEN